MHGYDTHVLYMYMYAIYYLFLSLIYSGDLLICWEDESPNNGVFSQLEKACIVLGKESKVIKSKGLGGNQSHRLLLCRMLWCKYYYYISTCIFV